MSRCIAKCLVVTLVWGALLTAVAAEELTKEQQAKQDAAQLLKFYEELHPKFEGIYGSSAIVATLEPDRLKDCETLEAKLKVLDETVVPVLQPFLATFAERYGENSADVEWALKQLKVEEHSEVGNRFDWLLRDLGNVQKTRAATAADLAGYVEQHSDVSRLVADVRVRKLELYKQFLQYAVTFDPNNDSANQQLAKMDQRIAAVRKAIEKEIEAGKWFGNSDDFSGPGSVRELTQAALTYFRKDRDWGREGQPDQKTKGYQILNVAIRGPWKVAETDVCGRVTCWRLPIHLAVVHPNDKGRNVARVFDLSLCAQIGPPGKAPKAPPFDGFWVGDSWLIRPNKVPKP